MYGLKIWNIFKNNNKEKIFQTFLNNFKKFKDMSRDLKIFWKISEDFQRFQK